MNLELYIARRFLSGREKNAVSVPIIRIALVGVALGVCIMLFSIFIITGFKQEITNKLTGFSAHLNIGSYGNINSYASDKIQPSDTLLEGVHALPEVKELYVYVTKPAILKSKQEIHGVVLHGVDSTFKGDFFIENLKEGEFPDFHTVSPSNEILLSSLVANYLNLQVGDKVTAHFVQDPPRARVFRVKGIYDTGFNEYDGMFVLCDIRHLQRLNGWKEGEVSGIAVELTNMDMLSSAEQKIDELIPWENTDTFYKVTTIYDMMPQLFEWLDLLNTNVWVILILLVVVAGFNMVSGLLILILDKTSLIGILKALGYRDLKLRKLFLYISIGLIGKGMLWGNGLAFAIAGIQKYWHVVSLDPANYYMDMVPIHFNIGYVILLNLGVLFVSTLMLIVPTMLISKIKPIKAIRFE